MSEKNNDSKKRKVPRGYTNYFQYHMYKRMDGMTGLPNYAYDTWVSNKSTAIHELQQYRRMMLDERLNEDSIDIALEQLANSLSALMKILNDDILYEDLNSEIIKQYTDKTGDSLSSIMNKSNLVFSSGNNFRIQKDKSEYVKAYNEAKNRLKEMDINKFNELKELKKIAETINADPTVEQLLAKLKSSGPIAANQAKGKILEAFLDATLGIALSEGEDLTKEKIQELINSIKINNSKGTTKMVVGENTREVKIGFGKQQWTVNTSQKTDVSIKSPLHKTLENFEYNLNIKNYERSTKRQKASNRKYHLLSDANLLGLVTQWNISARQKYFYLSALTYYDEYPVQYINIGKQLFALQALIGSTETEQQSNFFIANDQTNQKGTNSFFIVPTYRIMNEVLKNEDMFNLAFQVTFKNGEPFYHKGDEQFDSNHNRVRSGISIDKMYKSNTHAVNVKMHREFIKNAARGNKAKGFAKIGAQIKY